MLTVDEQKQIIVALQKWAEFAPDEPIMGFIQSGSLMTPGEIMRQVENHGPDGEAILQMIEHGVRREGLESVVKRLESPPAPTFTPLVRS